MSLISILAKAAANVYKFFQGDLIEEKPNSRETQKPQSVTSSAETVHTNSAGLQDVVPEESLTVLEKMIIAGSKTDGPASNEFVDTICNSILLLPCHDEAGTQPLIMADPKWGKSVVFFTSHNRVKEFEETSTVVKIKKVREVSIATYLFEAVEALAVVVNPGWEYYFTLDSDFTSRLKSNSNIKIKTLDMYVKEYFNEEIIRAELIRAILDLSIGVVVKNMKVPEEGNFATEVRDGKEYLCIFSSEKYAEAYKETHPEYPHDGGNKGCIILPQLTSLEHFILNPESDEELLFEAEEFGIKRNTEDSAPNEVTSQESNQQDSGRQKTIWDGISQEMVADSKVEEIMCNLRNGSYSMKAFIEKDFINLEMVFLTGEPPKMDDEGRMEDTVNPFMAQKGDKSISLSLQQLRGQLLLARYMKGRISLH